MLIVTNQYDLEMRFSKSQVRSLIAHNIEDSILDSIEILIQAHLDSSDSFYTSKRVRYAKLKSTSAREIAMELVTSILSLGVCTLQAHSTILGKVFFEDVLNAVKTGAELLAICEDSGLYEIVHSSVSEEGTTMLVPFFTVDEDIERVIQTTMYLPPMVEVPRDWEDNRSGGLYTTKSSCILGDGNHHEDTQALDVLNKLQKIEWTHNELALENEPRGDDKDFNRRANHSKYVRSLMPEKFYFVWKFDKRGRMYSQGYDINLQGNEYRKATIQFNKKENYEI